VVPFIIFDKDILRLWFYDKAPNMMTCCNCMEFFYDIMMWWHVVLTCIFMMRCLMITCVSVWCLTIQDVVMTMMSSSYDDMRELARDVDIMIITNALVACCEVVIVRSSTSGPRGTIYLMISWEPIPTRENIYKVISYGLGRAQSNSLCLWFFFLVGPYGKIHSVWCRVVMSKTQRMIGVFFHRWCCGNGFQCLGLCTWGRIRREFVLSFQDDWCTKVLIHMTGAREYWFR